MKKNINRSCPFSFCSCAKNYPQMVKDRVEQYQNEGKVILSQSNDDTGRKHYVVYGGHR